MLQAPVTNQLLFEVSGFHLVFIFRVLGKVEDPTAFRVLCFSIRILEGNGAALLSVASASLLLRSFPEATGKMTVSNEG